MEPRFANWKPSERIQAMTDEQIRDTRERLNVTVESDTNSEEGTKQDVAPIESFDDMVRAGKRGGGREGEKG